MTRDLRHWTPRPRPEGRTLAGRLVRLERLDPAAHAGGLFQAASRPGEAERFRWLFEDPPVDRAAHAAWVARAASGTDPLFHAVVDQATGAVLGRQALMRIEPAHGVIEIGSIYWGPDLAGTAGATEALFLAAAHVFDDLGYRRFEWKCNALNAPSIRAAGRFGFKAEGVFRQHMVVKGQNRDTAWFAMTDGDWQALRPAYQAWLAPGNFDATGVQRQRLAAFRAAQGGG